MKYFFIRSQLNRDLVLDVEGGSMIPGSRVVTWPKKDDDFDNQLWLEHRPTRSIRSKISGLCLDTEDGYLHVEPYLGKPSQTWQCDNNDEIITNILTGEALDIAERNSDAGAGIIPYEKTCDLNQQWDFLVHTDPDDTIIEFFYIKSLMGTDMVLDVEHGGRYAGCNVIMYHQKKWGFENQIFYEDKMGQSIKALINDMCLTVEGDHLTMQPHDPMNVMQRWKIDGTIIRNGVDPGQVLDVTGGDDIGATVAAWDEHGGENQQWECLGLAIEKACFQIRTWLNDRLVLDIEGGDIEGNTNVVTWKEKSHEYGNQMFYEDKDTGTIRTKIGDLCLDIDDHLLASGVVKIWPYRPGNPRQHWIIAEDTIVNVPTGKVLDIEGEDADTGAKMVAYDATDGINQKFDVEYVFEGDFEFDFYVPKDDELGLEVSEDSDCSDFEQQRRQMEKRRRRFRRDAGKPGRRIVFKRPS